MLRRFSCLMADDQGATAIEYALVASLISILIISGATLMGNNVANIFSQVANGL